MVDKSQHLSVNSKDSFNDRLSIQTGRRGNVTRSSHAKERDFQEDMLMESRESVLPQTNITSPTEFEQIFERNTNNTRGRQMATKRAKHHKITMKDHGDKIK